MLTQAEHEMLSDVAWARAIFLAEISWSSDLVGVGVGFTRLGGIRLPAAGNPRRENVHAHGEPPGSLSENLLQGKVRFFS
jgi:hypothetical protein